MNYINPVSHATPCVAPSSEIAEFFRVALPADDYICVAAKTPRGMQHRPFKNRTEGAAWCAQQVQRERDVYVSISTYRDPDLGRKTHNVAATQAHILDLDVGVGPYKFPSKHEALTQLLALCQNLSVPAPTLIDSGNGLHAWWIFKAPIPVEIWRETARQAKAICRAENFPADPSRTSDITSLMRVPYTYNFKDPANPKPVCIFRGAGHGTH